MEDNLYRLKAAQFRLMAAALNRGQEALAEQFARKLIKTNLMITSYNKFGDFSLVEGA